jgi:hypothetical protein
MAESPDVTQEQAAAVVNLLRRKQGLTVNPRLLPDQDWDTLNDMLATCVQALRYGGTAVLVVRMPDGNDGSPGYATVGFGEESPADAAELLRGAAAALDGGP